MNDLTLYLGLTFIAIPFIASLVFGLFEKDD